MIQEIWYCILIAEIGIRASFEQFPSYTESILPWRKYMIFFLLTLTIHSCYRCVMTRGSLHPWGHVTRVMESRQSRKSGTRPRVCRTCGQHHSHHEPHIYDYPEEVGKTENIQNKTLEYEIKSIKYNEYVLPSEVNIYYKMQTFYIYLHERTNKTLSVSRDRPIILIQPRYSSSRENKFLVNEVHWRSYFQSETEFRNNVCFRLTRT